MNAANPGHTAHEALVNEAMTAYVEWREASALVRDAYHRWKAAAREERPFAFVGYRGALEREEHAAAVYARVLASAETAFAA